jgi:valyl-tRNA synthetase
MVRLMPEHKKYNREIVEKFQLSKDIISSVRTIRKEKNIPQKEAVALYIKAGPDYDQYYLPVIKKLCNLSEITFTNRKIDGAASFLAGTDEYFVPLGNLLDKEAEMAKTQEELSYAMGFLESVMKKLTNERFVKNAPDHVIEMERKKKADAEARIKSLEEKLKYLGKL